MKFLHLGRAVLSGHCVRDFETRGCARTTKASTMNRLILANSRTIAVFSLEGIHRVGQLLVSLYSDRIIVEGGGSLSFPGWRVFVLLQVRFKN